MSPTILRRSLLVLAVVLLSIAGAFAIDGSDAGTMSASPKSSATKPNFLGIQADRYRIQRGEVPSAATFAHFLGKYGVDYRTALRLVEEARPEFDVKDLRAGHSYRVYLNPWLQKAQYFVYQMSPVEHVVFDVQRPGQTRLVRRPVDRTWRTVGGTVEGSLYETLESNGSPPLLALRLSEVFAWQIDFFRLRAGDRYRIVYEQRSVQGKQLQPGEIIAAYIKHRGKTYYAFRFEAGTEAEYFNRKGESLRRKLMKAPLEYSRISSRFTDRRYHPILKEYRPHHGTDYAAPRGTPVRSVGDGVVRIAGYEGPNGNYVKIRHNSIYTTGYLHLSEIAVRPGEKVEQGETIGYVGSTGRSTGPHLDYRLWKHGTAVNPYEIDLPPAQPVPLQYRDEFQRTVDALLPRLRRPSIVARTPSNSETGGDSS